MSQLLTRDPAPVPPATDRTGPDQGVIEEARRHQRRRRVRTAAAGLIVAAVIGAIAGALFGGASHSTRGHAAGVTPTGAATAHNASAPGFNVRLVPMLTVGQAGWCTVPEQDGIVGGDACGGLPTPSRPLLQVLGSYSSGARYEVVVAVTTPQVAEILIDGKRRVPTLALPGLPYGLRGARMLIPVGEPAQRLPGGRLPLHPPDQSLVALDARGQHLLQRPTSQPHETVRGWRYPERPAHGPCSLRATGLPGLAVRGGHVMTAIQPLTGQLTGRAFLSCIDTEYHLYGWPLQATVVLDAAHPRARAAALPDWKPVPRAPGFFSGGGLTATRSGNAWLVVKQGSGLAQRMRLLRHLAATVRL